VLCAGTIPEAPAADPNAADPAPVPVGAAAGGTEDAAGADDDEVLAEQALTPRSAAEIRMAAAQLVRSELPPEPRRRVTREIDMYPILPDLTWCPGPPSDAPSGTGNDQDALRR
jgi:hypothetical protein